MFDNTDFEMALHELAAPDPMDRAAILAAMKREFTPQELKHIIVGAGAALVVHGGKAVAADIDCAVDSHEALIGIAKRRGIEITRSQINGSPRVEVGGFAELFFDPATHQSVAGHLTRREVVINGVRIDSPEATVAWYQFMVKKMGRPKDHKNLEAALSLTHGQTL
jgi:hypothetical protein